MIRTTLHLRATVSALALAVCVTPAVAEEVKTSRKDPDRTVMERVMVIGSPEKAEKIAGSAQYIDKETLEQHRTTDIHRVLRQVPGVNIQEEEGYGNRPNIGLRGGRSERSADITLMEDGVLIAPAPYSAPAAYYFPRLSRMEAVEVRKGSSTVRFGPRTTSGAVNLITRSIPEQQEAEALIGFGSDNAQRYEGTYGNTVDNIGFLLNVSRDATDGFKTIDVVGGNTGYTIDDIMGKVRISTDEAADIYQSLELKIGATEEESFETYLGLTDDDFNARSHRRYAASQKDRMDAKHRQYQLRHYIDFGSIDATTTLYHNQFSREWYKLQSVAVGGTSSGLGGALNNPVLLDALRGGTDLDGSAANNLTIRSNARDYYATGIQTDLGTTFNLGKTAHNLQFGARYHYDKEDRFQQDDRFSITGGVMNLAQGGTPGSNANRHGTAKATALYVVDEIAVGRWTFSPGARYEYIELETENFANGQTTKNTVREFIPGMGVAYAVTDAVTGFAGVHKGFAPPSPGNADEKSEESINYEAGVRYNSPVFSAEVAGFFNEYSNLLGECTISSGCTGGNLGDQFNAGEVDAYGLEFSMAYDAAPALGVGNVSLPLRFNYTYTKAEFQNTFVSSFDEWGSVTKGDELPYIPRHQIFVSAGVVHPKWQAHVGGKFVDEMRTQAGSGAIPSGQGTDPHFLLDAAAEYEVFANTRLFVLGDNLTDKEYVAARRPAGARPGKPLTVLAGMKVKF